MFIASSRLLSLFLFSFFKLKCFAMNFLWKFYLLGDAVRQGSSLLSYNWIWSINGIFSHYTDQIIASNFDFSLKRATTLHDTSYFSAGSLFLRFLIAFCECERNGFVLPFVAATSSLLLRRHNTSPQLQIRLYTKLKDARRKVLGCWFGRVFRYLSRNT